MFKTFLAASYLNIWDIYGNKRLPLSAKVKATAVFFGVGTLLGAMVIQIRQMQAGKDPLPMGPTDWQFWVTAASAGGSLPIVGDLIAPYVFGIDSAYQDTGQQKDWFDLMPSVGLAKKTIAPFFDSLVDGFSGDFEKAKEDLGESAIETMKNGSALVGGRHMLIKPVLDHYLWNTLEDALAPETYAKRRRNQEKFARKMGTQFWWKPGNKLPDRAPASP